MKKIIKSLISPWLIQYETSKGGVLLTFDDGPDPQYTEQILTLLARYDIKAVFFILGEHATKHPELIKTVRAAGHVIGNHSSSHQVVKKSSFKTWLQDTIDGNELIEKYTGKRTSLYRPPEGMLSIMTLLILKLMRYRVVLWSIESGEWGVFSDQPTEDKILRMSEGIQENDIVLMHDNCEEVVVLLEKLLPIWLGKGIKFADPTIEFSLRQF